MVAAVTVSPRDRSAQPREKPAQWLHESSGKEAQGPDDTNAQDATTVWAISPPYNGTAVTSQETIIRSPSRTGTRREESGRRAAVHRVFSFMSRARAARTAAVTSSSTRSALMAMAAAEPSPAAVMTCARGLTAQMTEI